MNKRYNIAPNDGSFFGKFTIMKKEEVPQDDENMLQGKFKKLLYATDGAQRYTGIGSAGWEAENIVLQQAWDTISERIEDARQKVSSGQASILLYHMEKKLMDTSILAGYIGRLPFIVRLHMKPFFFKKLSKDTLEKYAYAFQLSVEDMMDMEKIKKPRS
jgi:hypothetical protein